MKRVLVTTVALAFAALAAQAQASTILYTSSGLDSNNHAISGTALFTTSANQLAITLTNTTPITYDTSDLLTAVKFTINGVTVSPTLASASATARTVYSTGLFTDSFVSSDLKALNTWETSLSSGVYKLDFNPDAKYAIIGQAESAGGYWYSQTNSSIESNSGHNPFAAVSASFVLNIPGLTANSVISGATLQFGTNFEKSVTGTTSLPPAVGAPSAVPVPAAVWGGGMLLVLMGASKLRRRSVNIEG